MVNPFFTNFIQIYLNLKITFQKITTGASPCLTHLTLHPSPPNHSYYYDISENPKIIWRLECVGYYFAYVAHFVFLGDVWIQTQRAAVESRFATKLAN
jgi:uncharacterized secreted protein with C-terminal beta-propeller domain